MELDIPTYDNQRSVMFYDVLCKLSHQQIKIHFQADQLDKIEKRMAVMQAIGGKVLYADKLAAIHFVNPMRKEKYDVQLLELF